MGGGSTYETDERAAIVCSVRLLNDILLQTLVFFANCGSCAQSLTRYPRTLVSESRSLKNSIFTLFQVCFVSQIEIGTLRST